MENVSFFIYLYNSKWMNKPWPTESRTILVDRYTVSGNYPVIFQVLAFQKVIHKRRQIHCLHCWVSHRHINSIVPSMWIKVVLYQNVNFDNYLTKMIIAMFFKTFWGSRSRPKHEENEWDVHIVENLIIFKLHYCVHDLMFQTTFLQSS